MRRSAIVVPIVVLGVLIPILGVHAGGQSPTGQSAVMPGVTHGRAATLKPLTIGRSAALPAPTQGSARLKGVTAGRSAALKPLTAGRAAGMKPAIPTAAPAAVPDSPFKPVGRGLVTPRTSGRTSGEGGLKEIAEGKSLDAGLTLAAVPGMLAGRDDRVLADDLVSSFDQPVYAYRDGYVLPYQARGLVREGFFRESFYRDACSQTTYRGWNSRLSNRFNRAGWGRTRLVVGRGSGYWGMNRVDHCGPQWYYRSSTLRRGCLPGRFVGGFYFPLGYYIRPIRHGSLRYNKTSWPILIPWDIVEAVPEDFERTLRKSKFPMVIGDMAFKRGNYVQAALAFRDGLDRHEEATPAGAFAFGDALVALRNYQFAERSIRGGLGMAPKWADHLDRRGVYAPGAAGQEDLAKHLREIEKFTQDYTKTASGWFLLGYLRMTSGDVGLREKAAEAFETLLTLQPGDELAIRYLDLLRSEKLEIGVEKESPAEENPEAIGVAKAR